MGLSANSLGFWATVIGTAIAIIGASFPIAKFIHKQTTAVVYAILVILLSVTVFLTTLLLSVIANPFSQQGNQLTPQNTVTNTPHNTLSPTLTTDTITPSPTTDTAYTSSPTKTLLILCDAVKAEDYATQWDQDDTGFRSSEWNGGYAEFKNGLITRDQNNRGVADCTFTNPAQNGSSESSTVTVTFKNGTKDIKMFLLEKSVVDGVWRITGFS